MQAQNIYLTATVARETLYDILLHITKTADEVNMFLGQLEICSVWICLINTHGNQYYYKRNANKEVY